MTTTPDPKIVREIAREFLLDDDLGPDELDYAVRQHINYTFPEEEFQAWRDAVDAAAQEGTVTKTASWPDEQPQDPQPWPRAQRMPLAIAGHHVQPWHLQAMAEYGEATGTVIEPNAAIPAGYTAAQVNWAITWWNERVEAEQPQDERELAWHGLRLFSSPALLDEGDVEQHELTHPEECRTLPPGAACWAEREPFRWWWPTAHGIYRIRPEDLSPLGGDGPDYQTTLRVQVFKDGKWFEYTNDVIGADPMDETPKILERLKAAVAKKAATEAAAQAERDGDADHRSNDAKALVKRTPEQWCERYGVDIADPDGWRHADAPAWDEPITLADFYQRARESTVRLVGSVDWKCIARDAEGGDQ